MSIDHETRIVPGKLSSEPVFLPLEFDVSPETDAVLERLASKIGGTKADVVLRGIALLNLVDEAEQQGQILCLADEELKVDTELVGFLSPPAHSKIGG